MSEVTGFVHDYCSFGEKRVYLLMAITRKNENEHLTENTDIVFREVLKKPEDVDRKVDKLQNAAESYTSDNQETPIFRLYVTVNARNTLDTYWNYRQRMDGWIQDLMNGDDAAAYKLKKIDSHWKSELQRDPNRDETRFLFDVDDPTESLDEYTAVLADFTEVVTTRETPNGYHVVTEPFDYNELPEVFTEDVEDVKTDSMMFLCYLTGRGDTDS